MDEEQTKQAERMKVDWIKFDRNNLPKEGMYWTASAHFTDPESMLGHGVDLAKFEPDDDEDQWLFIDQCGNIISCGWEPREWAVTHYAEIKFPDNVPERD